jgi:hypothetical protein
MLGQNETLVEMGREFKLCTYVCVTGPEPRDTLSIGTGELGSVTGRVPCDAHLPIIHQLARLITLALDGIVEAGMTGPTLTASIPDLTDVDVTLLSVSTKNLNVSRALLEPLHDLNHVPTRVLVGTVNALQLKIRPEYPVLEDDDGKGINGRCAEGLTVLSVKVRTLNLLSYSIRPVEPMINEKFRRYIILLSRLSMPGL